jgi:hypothetical protein
MKKKLYILLLFFSFNASFAQITIPAIKANFGVDADLRANYFNGIGSLSGDDWFSNGSSGSGQFMIDTTGAAAIIANYTTNPASRMNPFSRLMLPTPYSVVNNSLVLDAIFHRDFHGDDSTVFASGSNKNGMTPATWTCPISQNIPDKNDILDAFTHLRRAGPNVTDSLWMFGGISIENTNGNRYFDFELYQTDIYYDRTNRVFGGYGPNAGHTSWLFDAAGNVLRAGDIIFSAEYSSSSLTLVQARIWINQSALALNPVNFNWGGQFDGDGSGATYGYASITPKTAGAFYTGLQSANGVWAGPFELVHQDNSITTTYEAKQFMEFSVNLTKLGIDPGNFSNNACGTPFRRVLIKSRASTSFTSELKDFIAPFSMFNYTTVDAYTDLVYFCQTFPETIIFVQNPIPTSIYTWSTTNGHIIGANTGDFIVVDAPGTYYVQQQLHAQCPTYSIDSVVILFDSVCRILNVNFVNFNAQKLKNDIELAWQVSNNIEAANYEIEYSYNGIDFLPFAKLPASKVKDRADYSIKFPVLNSSPVLMYYRVKAIAQNGSYKYSNIITFSSAYTTSSTALIFPNPTHGELLWLSVKASLKEVADVFIWNTKGQLINNSKINIIAGDNTVKLPYLFGKPQGTYLIKIKSKNIDISKKVLVLN